MRLSCISFALVCAMWSPALAQEAPAAIDLSPLGQAAANRGLAPADVTFGHFHFSIMGIANEIAIAGSRFRDESERAELEGGAFYYVVDAIRDWERKYPSDPGIAHDLFAVEHVYRRLHNDAAREDADRALAWLENDYPKSRYTAMAREDASRLR